MYGTIARLQVSPGKLDEFMKFGEREVTQQIYPDIVFQHVFQSDQNENEVWLVVGFTSREAYHANARSPEQHERYLEMRSLLDADPEWHDGEVIQEIGG
jgi:quinol monooxygenase YgiN